MDDFVDTLDLQPMVDETGLEMGKKKNFECIYSRIVAEPQHVHIAKAIELHVDEYFSSMALPEEATLYDRLLVSLRSTDAVVTFNWDPFLFDAYQRNHSAVPLPEIFFLHGNVRVGACLQHERWGPRNGRCPDCGQHFTQVPLLYPIKNKDYSRDPYIMQSWEAAKVLVR